MNNKVEVDMDRGFRRVTIVIEVFNREITSAILLKLELERRGYRVSIKRKSEDISIEKSDILIIPNGYRTSSYIDYRYRFNCKSGRMINLQWEQLFTRYEEDHNKWLAEGRAKDLVFLCWGQNRVDRLEGVNVKKENIFRVGPIHTDTMRNDFSYIWQSRGEVANQFHLDCNKIWLLFISSLTFAPNDSAFINSVKKLIDYVDYDERHILEKNTQRDIIDWMERIISKRDDIIIIYRPHPTEKESPLLNEAKKKYPEKFNVISDMDLKQWIKISNVLVLWNSTSAIECSLAGKRSIVVRPYPIVKGEEYVLYDDCDIAETYEEFERKLTMMYDAFPISRKQLSYYYDITEKPSYIRICDVVDEIANDIKYENKEKDYQLKRIWYLIRRNIYGKLLIKTCYCLLYERLRVTIKNEKIRDKYFVDNWEKSVEERKTAASLERRIKSSFPEIQRTFEKTEILRN